VCVAVVEDEVSCTGTEVPWAARWWSTHGWT